MSDMESQEINEFISQCGAAFPSLTMSDLCLGSEFVKQETPVQAQVQVQVPMNMPIHLDRNPTLEKVSSNYEFEVVVPPDTNVVFNKEKLFIKMNAKMTIGVSYREQCRNEPLYLRSMIIFSKPAEMHLPVHRCANHRAPNASQEMAANIIKINDPKALYVGSENGETFRERLSVVVPMETVTTDENGKVVQSVALEFGCQNSCSSGINRRPTSIVFTLENMNAELLGKSAIEFKVCSCPKRDAEREREPKRKHDSNEPFPRGKRPKYAHPQSQLQPHQIKPEPDLSESDSSEVPANNEDQHFNFSMTTVPTFQMPTDLVPKLYEAAFNLVAGKMVELGTRGQHLEGCLRNIKKLRKKAGKEQAQ